MSSANVHPMPPPVGLTPDNIPQALKDTPQWMPWVRQPRLGKPGKFDKIPALGRGTHRPERWATFDEALVLLDNPNYAGLSLCLTGLDGLVTFDLDGAVVDGAVKDWAREIVGQVGSYTELSPSGNGLRIFAKGSAPDDWANHEVGIEVYSGKTPRHATVTGCHLEGTPTELVELPPELLASLEAKYRKSKPSALAAGPLPDLVDVGPIEDAGLPEHVLRFLRDGNEGSDGSGALFTAACALCKLHGDDVAYAYLVNNTPAWEVVSRHRSRHDEGEEYEARLEYLWQHHVRKARATVGPVLGEVSALFEDLDPAPTTHAAPMRGFTPHEWVLVRVLPTGLTLIAGGHGGGKTSLLVPLASMSSGELDGTAHGLPVDLHRTVFYFTEDPDQAHRIRAGLLMHCGLADNGRFHIKQARRRTASEVKALVAKIVEEYTVEGPNGYLVRPLIVFDTINACFEIENENDASQVGQVMAAIKTASKGTPVWLVGHLPKSLLMKDVHELTARGSGAWEADAQCTAFIVADDKDPDVRYLVTKKRRFETDATEVRFETHLGSVTVDQPWGGTQEMLYRYGVPERAVVSRQEAKEKRKDAERYQAVLEDTETLVEHIRHQMALKGEVWMYRRGKGGSPKMPVQAEGRSVTWPELYYTSGIVEPKAPGLLQEAVRERFEPFVGWGRLVFKGEGDLW